MGTAAAVEPGAPAPGDARAHLDAELRHLDLLLLREFDRFKRTVGEVQSGQGIYITGEEVEHLLTGAVPDDLGSGPDDVEDRVSAITRSRALLDAAVTAAEVNGTELPLASLRRRAGLSTAETVILVACLAPELDRRYDRIYAYLQDDLIRRRPSVDLVTRLVSDDRYERWDALGLLSEHAPLLAHGLLRVVPDLASPSGTTALGRLLQVAPTVVAHLLGRVELDPALTGAARTVDAGARPRTDAAAYEAADPGERAVARALRIARRAAPVRPVVVHVHGAQGSGQPAIARAVATALGRGHVEVRCANLSAVDRGSAVRAVLRDAWLAGRPILLLDADPLLRPETGTTREQLLDAALSQFPGLVLTTGDQEWPPGPEPEDVDVHQVRLDPLEPEARRRLWQHALSASGLAVNDCWAGRLAEAVRLGPATIGEVAREVCDAAAAHDPAHAGYTDWLAAARRRATQRLEGLARPVPTGRGWDDLVLDDDRAALLHGICDYVRLRDIVLGEWGMGARTGVARGLTVLFAGPPGTGKTMAAGVLAAELGLELFVIDLSQVVSKYIGETEKNLAHVFDAAEDSGAVLLFDEADALFGTRTEISDAHDRYANIETSYLLQRMEEYDGVAVLASNLRQNMDEAFLRRLRFVIDFPLPGPEQRRRIWERHLSGGVPVDKLDLDLLAHRLPVAGGSIRNIALAAAFLAAGERSPLGMDHLARASRREFEKLGKLWRDPLNGAARTEMAR